MSLPEYLTDAFSAAIETEGSLEVAREKHRAALHALREAVVDHGIALAQEGADVSRDFLEQLYWDTPSLGAPQIVEAYGLRSTNDLSRMVASRDVIKRCLDCGTKRSFRVRNRSELSKLPVRCNACQGIVDAELARRAAIREEKHANWRRRDSADYLESVKDYLRQHPDIPDKPAGIDTALVSVRTCSGYTEVPVEELRRIKALMEPHTGHLPSPVETGRRD